MEFDEEIDFGYEEEKTFAPSIKVFERIGLPGDISSLIGSTMVGDIRDLQKRINKMVQDPTDRFIIYTDAIVRRLISSDAIRLSEDNIVDMLKKAKNNVKNVGYKNPTAYILGYIASEGGMRMTKQNVNNVLKNILPQVGDESVSEQDVIRYARLWMSL